jgi:hypothetical protein
MALIACQFLLQGPSKAYENEQSEPQRFKFNRLENSTFIKNLLQKK